ncbi:MAG: DUF2214 family protein [Pseudomonadota bacterium]
MLLSALAGFAHFMAYFAMVAALVLQLVLLQDRMSAQLARRIQRADRVLGVAALLLLVIGFLRVIYFEKGADYYFSNLFFQMKLGFFFAAAVLSVHPSLQYMRWGRIEQEVETDPAMVLKLKKIIHWELILMAAMMLCASLMAKGFGL